VPEPILAESSHTIKNKKSSVLVFFRLVTSSFHSASWIRTCTFTRQLHKNGAPWMSLMLTVRGWNSVGEQEHGTCTQGHVLHTCWNYDSCLLSLSSLGALSLSLSLYCPVPCSDLRARSEHGKKASDVMHWYSRTRAIGVLRRESTTISRIR
jgi:hypothetical protein